MRSYTDIEALIVFGTSVVGRLDIRSAIKQGCIASGTAFALAIDPFFALPGLLDHPEVEYALRLRR